MTIPFSVARFEACTALSLARRLFFSIAEVLAIRFYPPEPAPAALPRAVFQDQGWKGSWKALSRALASLSVFAVVTNWMSMPRTVSTRS